MLVVNFKNYRVYILAAVAYLGSVLFGYDTGVMGSLIALRSFKEDFGLPTNKAGFATAKNAQVAATVVSLLTAGCFFGAIIAAFFNERFGRRYSLLIFTVVFLAGASLQTAAQTISHIYAGRVLAGLGIGGMSSITPVYVSENSPPNVRGRIVGLFQILLILGVVIAYWLDYAVALLVTPGTKQWRIPLAVQLIPAGLLFIGLIFLKESPRWLVKKGRMEEALDSLAYFRNENPSSPNILAEFAEIKAAIAMEIAIIEGVTWKECLHRGNRQRFLIAFGIMVCQQLSGTNSIGYYAPQIFQTVGVSSTNAALFATGVYGTVKLITGCAFLAFGIERWGRRNSLIYGALWMAIAMFIIGAVLATKPPLPEKTNGSVSSASIAMVVMIYLYIIGYSASWGPTPWVYTAEIFPNRLREYGVSLAASTQWLFNFVITEITPLAVSHIGWRTFIMFGIFCLANGTFTFFLVKETKGHSLEQMDVIFGLVSKEERHAHVENMLKKSPA